MTERRRFRFERCLGRGGFGEVYRAQMVTSSGLHRTVAVKTLHARLHGDDDAVRRLRDEARLLGALHHRGIVQVYDLVELQGQLALVTEYLDGEDLDQVLKRTGPLPARVAVELVGEVAAALHTAYTTAAPGTETPMRLVHRDIKPSNIRLTSKGGVKLLDFGIALSPSIDREAKTGTGLVIGTVGYLSPDRLTDESVDPSSDIYGLGCVLFEAVRRRRLYNKVSKAELFRLALDPDVHDAFIGEQLDLVPEGGAPLHPALRALMARLLAYDPRLRPTARELEELCDDLAAELPSPHLRRWARARKWPEPSFESGKLDGLELSASGMIDTLAPPRTSRSQTPPDTRPTVADPTHPDTPDVGPSTVALPPPAAASTIRGPAIMVAIAAATVLLGVLGWFWLRGPTPVDAPERLPSSLDPNVVSRPEAPAVPDPTAPVSSDPAPSNPAPSVAPDSTPTEVAPPAAPPTQATRTSEPQAPAPPPPRAPTSVPEPPAEAPEPAAAEAALGVVQFNSIPYSKEIVVDGTRSVKAKKPVMLSAGAHTVQMRTADGRTVRRTFTVESGGAAVVCWSFEDGSPCD